MNSQVNSESLPLPSIITKLTLPVVKESSLGALDDEPSDILEEVPTMGMNRRFSKSTSELVSPTRSSLSFSPKIPKVSTDLLADPVKLTGLLNYRRLSRKPSRLGTFVELDTTIVYHGSTQLIEIINPGFSRSNFAFDKTNPNLLQRRLMRIEATLRKMTSATSELLFTDRKKLLSKVQNEYCCPASEIIDWLTNPNNAEFFSREEAVGYMQVMLEYGYVISCEFLEKFKDDDSFYTIQSPNMWYTDTWHPSEGGK